MTPRLRISEARVARLATADAGGVPHLVPVTFALADDRLFIAIDHKPKRTTALRRLRNIAQNPHVSLLVDHYADDWTTLWWARADGTATIMERGDEREKALDLLADKYAQYREQRPEGPVIKIAVSRYSDWAYTPEE